MEKIISSANPRKDGLGVESPYICRPSVLQYPAAIGQPAIKIRQQMGGATDSNEVQVIGGQHFRKRSAFTFDDAVTLFIAKRVDQVLGDVLNAHLLFQQFVNQTVSETAISRSYIQHSHRVLCGELVRPLGPFRLYLGEDPVLKGLVPPKHIRQNVSFHVVVHIQVDQGSQEKVLWWNKLSLQY